LGAFSLSGLHDPTPKKFLEIEVKPALPQIHPGVLLLTDFFSFPGKPEGRISPSLFGVL